MQTATNGVSACNAQSHCYPSKDTILNEDATESKKTNGLLCPISLYYMICKAPQMYTLQCLQEIFWKLFI